MTTTIEEVYDLGIEFLDEECYRNNEVRDQVYDRVVDAVLQVDSEKFSLAQIRYFIRKHVYWGMCTFVKKRKTFVPLFEGETGVQDKNLKSIDIKDLFFAHTIDDVEREIVSKHVYDYSSIKIAASCSLPEYKVRAILVKFKDNVRKALAN